MSIHFYRPNKSNKGSACSFWTSPKNGGLFATLIKQSGWNTATRTGSFKESLKNPDTFINVKLTGTEAAAIIDCIERGRPFSTVHDTETTLKTISFIPWVTPGADGKSIQKGFSFSVWSSIKANTTSDKNGFFIGITLPEGRLLKEFLIYHLHNSFCGSQAKGNGLYINQPQPEPEPELDKETNVESPTESPTEAPQKYDTDNLMDL